MVFAALCGVCVALCGLASGGAAYGTGYEEARNILHGDAAAGWGYAPPLKFAATVLSSISGIPGGLFAPSLAVGAGLGGAVHGLLPEVPVGALVLIGMVAYLTGVLQAPITSFVIVTEMTQNHAMMIPLMVAGPDLRRRLEGGLPGRALPHAAGDHAGAGRRAGAAGGQDRLTDVKKISGSRWNRRNGLAWRRLRQRNRPGHRAPAE